MSSALVIAFVFALGASVWIYSQLQRQSGSGNSKNALIGSGIAFVLLFFVVFTIAHMFVHN